MLPRLAILITTFNRCETTIRCLDSIFSQTQNSYLIDVYIVDAGSDDMTVQMIKKLYPVVNIQIQSGLFWNMGMREAWKQALVTDYDFYLWLNDDVFLSRTALYELSQTSENFGSECIVVGKLFSQSETKPSYGALKLKSRMSQLNFCLLSPEENIGHTFNGNVVLVPREVVKKIGILSDKFSHSSGDIEYGLRASRNKITILQTTRSVGSCEQNLEWNSSINKITIGNWKYIFFHPKGVPISEWFYMCKTYGGLKWPINFLWRYIKMVRI